MTTGSIADIFTALGTLAMAFMAGSAIRAWRKEYLGKKQIELASEIMIIVMDFQDIIISARNHVTSPMELSEIRNWLCEVNTRKQNIPNSMLWPIYEDRLACLLPIHRLNKSSETIEKFSEILNKCLIYFGEDIYKLLVEMYSFLGKIRQASEMLYENPNNLEFEAIAFANDINNPISKRIFDIGEEIKQNLEPIYKDQQIKWKKLKKS